MKPLTKAEEQVMMALWKMGSGLLMEIVEAMPAPIPHKNTVATLLKILTEKEMVTVEPIKRIHRYHPKVSKDEYSKASLAGMAKGYFEGSFSNIVSFLVDKKQLSVNDLELLLKELKKK